MELKKTIYQIAKELNLKGREKAAFLATIDQETGGFKTRKEKTFTAKNLKNYRDSGTFSKLKGMSDKDIDILVSKGSKAIFDKIYGDRKDLGNAADEGYKYRGRGLFQHTGKNNYKKLSKEIFPEAPNTLVDNPELVNNSEVMKKIAKNYWSKISNKVDFSKKDSMDRVTDIVNLKDIHRERRNKLFKKYLSKSAAKKQIKQDKDQESFLRPSPIKKQFEIDERGKRLTIDKLKKQDNKTEKNSTYLKLSKELSDLNLT